MAFNKTPSSFLNAAMSDLWVLGSMAFTSRVSETNLASTAGGRCHSDFSAVELDEVAPPFLEFEISVPTIIDIGITPGWRRPGKLPKAYVRPCLTTSDATRSHRDIEGYDVE
jgi:hypothetical protein